MEIPLTYEAAYAELEAIYQAIAGEAVSVDELAEKVKRAAALVEFCQGKLKSTEEEISRIVAGLGTNQKPVTDPDAARDDDAGA